MDKKQRLNLFKDYYKSISKGKVERALKQNRVLYNEIFEFNDYVSSNGFQEKVKAGLNQLEIESTEICKILGFIKLNPMEEL